MVMYRLALLLLLLPQMAMAGTYGATGQRVENYVVDQGTAPWFVSGGTFSIVGTTLPVIVINSPSVYLATTSVSGSTITFTNTSISVTGSSVSVNTPGVLSTFNSSTTTLASSATFTGTFEDVKDYAAITFIVFADRDSAIGGLKVQWSSDGVNADVSDNTNVSSGTGRAFSLTPRAGFFRLVYVNGASAQGVFRLQTTYHQGGSGLISRPLSNNLDDSNYAQTVRSVMSAKLSSGAYQSATMGQTTMANSVAVTIASNQSPVATFFASPPTGQQLRQGQVTTSAVTTIRKTSYVEQTTDAQRSLVSSSALDISTGTGARTVMITYYSSALAGPFTETLTMNGTTAVNTVNTNICYIESLHIVTDGSFGGAVGTVSLKVSTGGAGATIATIAPADFRTQWAHHYVATGTICYLSSVHVAAGQASGGTFTVQYRQDDQYPVHNHKFMPLDVMRMANSASYTRPYNNPLALVGPGLLLVLVTPDSNSTLWFATLDFYDQ